MKRLLARLLIVAAMLLPALVVAPQAAQAHDQGFCSVLGGYVQCIFAKHGLPYVSNKFANAQGTQYLCGQSRITYYSGSGAFLLRVTSPKICANALQYIDYTAPYERTYARKVCANWYISSPALGYTRLFCVSAPW